MSNNSVAGLDAKYVESKPIDFSSDGDASTERSSRLHYLDWLRVILFFGVFLFHAVHPFGAFDWHIKNDNQSIAFTAVILVLLYP